MEKHSFIKEALKILETPELTEDMAANRAARLVYSGRLICYKSSIGNNINQLAAKANTLGFIDAPMLKNEAAKWNKFQSEIERTYLRPNQSEMKWQ